MPSSGGDAGREDDAAPYQAEVDEGLGAAVAILVDTSGSMRETARRATRGPSMSSRGRRSRRCSTPPTRSSRKRPDFPIKIGIYSFSSSVRTLRPIQPYDRAAIRAGAGDAAAARRRHGDRRGDARGAAGSVPRRRLPQVPAGRHRRRQHQRPAARTTSRARSSARARARVQIYFVAFDTSPEKFAFLKEVGGDVIGAGTGDGAAQGARRHLSGQDPRRGARRRRKGTGQEVASSYSCKGDTVILHKFWSAVRGADQQGREPVLGGRSGRADALRVRPGGRAAQGRPRRPRAVPRPGRARHAPGRRRTGRTSRSSKPRPRPTSRPAIARPAAKFALELQKAKEELAANEQQLEMHETAYGNNLKKIQHANEKLIELREKIQKYDAELKMSAAEAEIAKLSETFDVNLTTDFGEIESVIQQKIDQNRGKVRVAADLSSKGIAEIKAEERMQGAARRAGAAELRGRARAQVAGNDAGRAGGEGPRAGRRHHRQDHREADKLGFTLWRTDSPDRPSTSRFCSSSSASSASRSGGTARSGPAADRPARSRTRS